MLKFLQNLLFLALALPGMMPVNAQDLSKNSCSPLLDFNVKRLNSNEEINLCAEYSGKVILIVNTASRCAFTGQYETLEKLYADYKDRGLVVLGFPSNDFGNQEPGSEAQIKDFCRMTYGVKFPMFAKTQVTKSNAAPVYRALGEAAGRYPKWNFHKYLIGRDGQLIDDYLSWTSPESKTVRKAIEDAL